MRLAKIPFAMIALLGGLTAVVHPVRAQNLGTFANTTFINPLSGKLDTASVNFTLVQGSLGVAGSNSYLAVTLSNTSTYSSGWVNGDLLSGVLFQLNTTSNGPTATAYSAVTTLALINASQCDASAVTKCSTGPVDVSTQWLFQKSASGYATTGVTPCAAAGSLTSAQYGIVTSQYACLNPNFGSTGKNFVEPGAPVLYSGNAQLAFSIIGKNYVAAQHGGASANPYENTSVTFDLALAGTVTTLSASTVTFTYGTNPDASSGGVKTPEPGTIAVLSTGLVLLGVIRRPRRRRVAR